MEIFNRYREELEEEGVVYLDVKVIPKANRTEFVEMLLVNEQEVLKIKVAAVPEKGKANAELCGYLAGKFEVAKSQVRVVSGMTSQRKVMKVMK
jgi:uncharacterized protein